MARVVVSYIPALHRGYLNFFSQYPGKILVLDETFVKEAPRMDRDIRAMDPEAVASMLKGFGLEAEVLSSKQDLNAVKSQSIIMPDEDVNRIFANKHLKGSKVKFVSVFLRWDRQISTTELVVPPHRTISTKKRDEELMKLSHKEAAKAADWWRQIGAVLVKNSKPQVIGHNRPLGAEDYSANIFGDPRSNFDAGEYIELAKTIHAEAGVIAEAARIGLATEGASIYVSTFPCPVCAKLIAASGIKKVYYDKGYSLLDAEDILNAAGIEIILVK